jgi:FTO C-terminal domain
MFSPLIYIRIYHLCPSLSPCVCPFFVQALLSELEFEWLRQWWVQGRAHADAHGWWAEPIQRLTAHWAALEDRTATVLVLLWGVSCTTV